MHIIVISYLKGLYRIQELLNGYKVKSRNDKRSLLESQHTRNRLDDVAMDFMQLWMAAILVYVLD